MSKPITVGVLTPLLDGFYFSNILSGIQQQVSQKGAQMIVFQTMDTKLSKCHYRTQLAFDHIDGWIILLRPVDDQVLIDSIKTSGKPIVCTPFGDIFEHSQVFMVDNYGGMYDAVAHLISHGHRDIVFVGCMENVEVKGRYEGYKQALADHGISLKEELVFHSDEMHTQAGYQMAKEVLASGVAFTAIAAAADLLAIAMMERFQLKGIRIPEDIAFVSFDDIDSASRVIPPLSSVSQGFMQRGSEMAKVLVSQIQGEIIPPGIMYDKTQLMIRESCGCKTGKERTASDIDELNAELFRYLTNVIQRNHEIGKSLVKADPVQINDLSWLSVTNYSWGCFALWKGTDNGKILSIESVYSNRESEAIYPGMLLTPEAFPPLGLLPDSIRGGDDVVSVHVVRTESKEWGYVVLVGSLAEKVRTAYHYDTMTHIFDLLGNALERESLYSEVRIRGQRLQKLVEHLEIVSSTTNDGIFDWNLQQRKMEWNQRIINLLDIPQELLQMNEDLFLGMIHYDDRAVLNNALYDHLHYDVPFRCEFRMMQGNGAIIWVNAAGQVLRNKQGLPERVIGSLSDITERKINEQQITHLAYHDSLTELPNRLLFYQHLKDAVEQGDMFAVLLLDLDRFKVINDSLGHETGDQVLKYIAKVLLRNVRPMDTVGRLGGDEFIILMPLIESRQVVIDIVDQIIKELNTPFVMDGLKIYVTASIGISFYPDHDTNLSNVMKHADVAMYRAKQHGRNKYEIYSTDLRVQILDRLNMENNLRKALASNEFSVYYQPQVDLVTREIYGLEALLRWQSPELGFVSPGDFIPIAEESGLIVALGNYVLHEACMQHKRLREEGFGSLVISVNISGIQLMELRFLEQVKGILKETQMEPRYLRLEITESVAVSNTSQMGLLEDLIALGIQISIDDFGTGNSSLFVLKTLPIDTLKIDKSFIRDMTADADDLAIVKAIVAMCKSLELYTCAEGVETEEQMRLLEEIGCDAIQGYWISRPMPPSHVLSFLNQWVMPSVI